MANRSGGPSRGDMALDLVRAVYSNELPLDFEQATAVTRCVSTGQQDAQAMANRRLCGVTRLTKGLVNREGRGVKATFHRGKRDWSADRAVTHLRTL